MPIQHRKGGCNINRPLLVINGNTERSNFLDVSVGNYLAAEYLCTLHVQLINTLFVLFDNRTEEERKENISLAWTQETAAKEYINKCHPNVNKSWKTGSNRQEVCVCRKMVKLDKFPRFDFQ